MSNGTYQSRWAVARLSQEEAHGAAGSKNRNMPSRSLRDLLQQGTHALDAHTTSKYGPYLGKHAGRKKLGGSRKNTSGCSEMDTYALAVREVCAEGRSCKPSARPSTLDRPPICNVAASSQHNHAARHSQA